MAGIHLCLKAPVIISQPLGCNAPLTMAMPMAMLFEHSYIATRFYAFRHWGTIIPTGLLQLHAFWKISLSADTGKVHMLSVHRTGLHSVIRFQLYPSAHASHIIAHKRRAQTREIDVRLVEAD